MKSGELFLYLVLTFTCNFVLQTDHGLVPGQFSIFGLFNVAFSNIVIYSSFLASPVKAVLKQKRKAIEIKI